jgi:hypothetical protein
MSFTNIPSDELRIGQPNGARLLYLFGASSGFTATTGTKGAEIDVYSEVVASLADDGTHVPQGATVGAMVGWVQAGDGEEAGLFVAASGGTVKMIAGTANVDDADTDTDLCFFDNGGTPTIKNRLGAAKSIAYWFWVIP